MNSGPIGVFDSGIGGLNILTACEGLMPNEDYVYLFDKSCAPYGDKNNAYVASRAGHLTEMLVDMRCKAVVIACNTATNVAIENLRKYYEIPIFGVEPPILPAVRQSEGGKIIVLLTPVTARQQKFKTLLSKCGSANVVVLPQERLATLIEKNLNDIESVKGHVHSILDGQDNVESVVLGCTHYYFIKNIINEYFGGRVKVYDASQAVARQVFKVLSNKNLLTNKTSLGKTDLFNV